MIKKHKKKISGHVAECIWRDKCFGWPQREGQRPSRRRIRRDESYDNRALFWTVSPRGHSWCCTHLHIQKSCARSWKRRALERRSNAARFLIDRCIGVDVPDGLMDPETYLPTSRRFGGRKEVSDAFQPSDKRFYSTESSTYWGLKYIVGQQVNLLRPGLRVFRAVRYGQTCAAHPINCQAAKLLFRANSACLSKTVSAG